MSFGFDPEFFVMTKKARNTATSIHLVPKFKGYTYGSVGKDDKGGMQSKVSMKTDGFAVELNSVPETCRDRLVPSVALALRKFYKSNRAYKLSAIPVMPLSKASITGKVPEGVNEFGCLPDRNAYTLLEKTPPRSDYHNNVRYAGGHIHWGMTPPPGTNRELYMAAYIIKQDIVTGIPLVAILGKTNDYGEATRRVYYGQAGSHRVKPYGVEWRVPSSVIMMSPILFSWVIGHMRGKVALNIEGCGFSASPRTDDRLSNMVIAWQKKFDFNRVQDIINGHMVEEAKKFITEFGLTPSYQPSFFKMMLEADSREIPMNNNLFEAWALDGNIKNHSYIGVESAMATGKMRYSEYNDKYDHVTADVEIDSAFPPLTLRKANANGWGI